MSDELTLKLSSPLTDEQMDLIMDYDLDHTSSIWFHTKHGKNVEFVKAIRCKDCKYREHYRESGYMCGLDTGDPYMTGRNAEDDDWFCADAERKEHE